jgi:integrase
MRYSIALPMMIKEPSVASVYLTKNKKLLRCELRIKGQRRVVSFPLTPVLKKDHQFITNLINDIEDAAKSGCDLTKASQEALRVLNETNPKKYQQMVDEGWFRSVTNFSIAEAFDCYIESQEKQRVWDWKTVRNWKATKSHLLKEIPPETSVSKIILKQVDQAFTHLRETYKPGTLDKDAKNVRQLFAWLLDMGDISVNPIAKLKFKCRKEDRVRAKDFVSMEAFKEVLAAFKDEEIEQKTLFAYYRIMGARQNDPIGDYWEDLDEKASRINRYDIKKRAKLGPCPVPPLMMKLLSQHRAAMFAKHGKAEGLIFPWLKQSTPANQSRYFRARIERTSVSVWEPLLHSLRSSRSQEIRRMPNGAFLESQWLGHSVEMAQDHYDDVMECDMDYAINDSVWQDHDDVDAVAS